MAEPVEEFVAEAVMAAIDSPELYQRLAQQPVEDETILVNALQADEDALEQLAKDHYADHLISRAEFLAARDLLNQRIEANRSRIAALHGKSPLQHLSVRPVDIRKEWEGQTLEWRRAVLSSVIDHVVLKPALKGRNFFDHTLVEIVWKY